MKLKLFIFFLSVAFSLSAQNAWQWAQAGSGSGSDTGNGVATDGAGNAFVTGYFFSPTLTFGTYTLTNTGNYETFIVKYDGAGTVQWAKSAAGAFDDVANAITCDPSGNIYITGYFTSPTLVFDTYTLTNVGGLDFFIVKYDTNGNVLWAKSEGGSNSEQTNAITCDASGNIFVTGNFLSGMFSIGTTTLTNSGGGDVFIAKYNSAGTPLWAISQDGAALDIGYGLSTDNSGNVFVCGSFKSTSLSAGTFTVNNAAPGQADMFLAKYNSSGAVVWLKSTGGNFEEVAYGVTVDFTGQPYVTGSYKSANVVFGATTLTNTSVGVCEIFTAKYDANGTILWARSIGGTSDDIGYGIDIDAAGTIFITGHMHSSAMMVGSFMLVNAGTSVGDVFVVRYTPVGTVIWAEREGDFSDDGGASVACTNAGDVFFTGFFVGPTITFGSTILNNTGNSDVMLAKLGNSIGVNELGINLEDQFSAYPNPNTGVFSINSNVEIKSIEIFNDLGEFVFFGSPTLTDINIADKPKGIYFVRIITANAILSKKIILE